MLSKKPKLKSPKKLEKSKGKKINNKLVFVPLTSIESCSDFLSKATEKFMNSEISLQVMNAIVNIINSAKGLIRESESKQKSIERIDHGFIRIKNMHISYIRRIKVILKRTLSVEAYQQILQELIVMEEKNTEYVMDEMEKMIKEQKSICPIRIQDIPSLNEESVVDFCKSAFNVLSPVKRKEVFDYIKEALEE